MALADDWPDEPQDDHILTEDEQIQAILRATQSASTSTCGIGAADKPTDEGVSG